MADSFEEIASLPQPSNIHQLYAEPPAQNPAPAEPAQAQPPVAPPQPPAPSKPGNQSIIKIARNSQLLLFIN